MKKTLFSVAIVMLSLAIGFTACKKDNSSNNDTSSGNNYFAAKVSGISYTSTSTRASLDGSRLTVFGFMGKQELGFNVNFTRDAHQLGSSLSADYGVYSTDTTLSGNLIMSSAGSVIISEIDSINKTITGTFNMTLKDTSKTGKKVDGGLFIKVPFTTKGNGTGTVTNSLSCAINGITFSPISTTGTFYQSLNQISISAIGNTSGFPILTLALSGDATTGQYSIDGTKYALSYSESSSSMYVASPGSVTIASHDKTNKVISGSFTATLLNSSTSTTKTLTSGTFLVKYN